MKRSLLCLIFCSAYLTIFGTTRTCAGPLTLSDEVLMSSEFTKSWGPASVSRTDPAGPGVLFEFSGLGSSGTAVSDGYPVLDAYGQVGGSDFTNFTSYRVSFTNMSASGYVHVNIFINTGFTSGSDGGHTHSSSCDTFWEDGWTYLEAGSSVEVVLDFASATAWNISDNSPPHSVGSPDGGAYEINMYDRGQFTRIGFQVADFSGTSPDATILVRACEEPISVQESTWGRIKALYK